MIEIKSKVSRISRIEGTKVETQNFCLSVPKHERNGKKLILFSPTVAHDARQAPTAAGGLRHHPRKPHAFVAAAVVVAHFEPVPHHARRQPIGAVFVVVVVNCLDCC